MNIPQHNLKWRHLAIGYVVVLGVGYAAIRIRGERERAEIRRMGAADIAGIHRASDRIKTKMAAGGYPHLTIGQLVEEFNTEIEFEKIANRTDI